MSGGVVAVVLAAAFLHATWNSLVKSAPDKFAASAVVCLWCGVFAAGLALALPLPSPASYYCVAASAVIHVVYFFLVGLLYRNADLSVAYPLMRGTAPLIAAGIAAFALRELPSLGMLVGAATIVLGVLTLASDGLAKGRADRATVAVALINAVVIATYSVVDGLGARLAGPDAADAIAYNAWTDAATAVLFAPAIAVIRGSSVFRAFWTERTRGAIGGAAAFVGYSGVCWAMTVAPISVVAALRETSAFFAAAIGALFLAEPIGRVKAGAIGLIVLGAGVLSSV